MKKILILALTLFLIVQPLLVGCNTAPAETTGREDPAPTTTVPSDPEPDPDTLPIYIDPTVVFSFSPYPSVPEEYEVVVTRLPETVENPDGLPVLKWVYLQSQLPAKKWSDMAMVEINQMLADRDMPFRLQLIMVEMTDLPEFKVDWTLIPEAAELIAEADLLYGLFPQRTAGQYLLPITGHVTGDAQPNLQNAVPHARNWMDTTYGGEIYGIPIVATTAASNGWRVETKKLEQWGLTAQDFQKDFWEMDELFAKIYEANGKKSFLKITAGASIFNTHPNRTPSMVILQDQISSRYQREVGAFYALDLKGDSPKVVNPLEEKEFRLIQTAALRYKDAEYVIPAGHTEGSGEAKVSLLFGETEGVLPYTNDGGYTYIPVTESYYAPLYPGYLYLSGVAAHTPYASEAIMLLNLIAEDEAFRDHLCFGKQGRDYRYLEGLSVPISITDEDGSSYSQTYLSPLQMFSSVRTGAPQEKLEAYREALDSVTYVRCPVTFDFSGFEQELTELGVVYGNFWSMLFNIQPKIIEQGEEPFAQPRMPEKNYDRMLQLMKDVGSDKILADLQVQLDAWLKENPDWTAKLG